jgi:hypothetical protein
MSNDDEHCSMNAALAISQNAFYLLAPYLFRTRTSNSVISSGLTTVKGIVVGTLALLLAILSILCGVVWCGVVW